MMSNQEEHAGQLIRRDWDVSELGQLEPFVTSGSRGWARYYSAHGNPFIRITNLSRESIYLDLSALKFVTLPSNAAETERTALQDDDLLVSITADIGIIGFVDASLPKPAFINQHIALVRISRDKADSRFLSYYLASEGPQRRFRSNTDQGAKAGMNLASIRRIKIVLPPIAEQHAISDALRDIDALLDRRDQLLAKKRDLKQATMQQLLTGRTRLPGFSVQWTIRSMADIGRVRGGSGFPTRFQGVTSGDYPFFKVSDMNNEGNDTFMVNANNWISDATRKVLGATSFPAGSIIFAKVGAAVFLERKKILVAPSCIDNNLAGFVPDTRQLDTRFIHYALLRTSLSSLVSTTALPSLSGAVFSKIELSVPPLAEQRAIAAVLSDMDAELSVLKARRDKTQALKEAMMQELLTGRTRLL
jgi:type I restriction enzyme S subunit